MKIDFEKVLAEYGLKVGDKIRFTNHSSFTKDMIFELVENKTFYLENASIHFVLLDNLGAYEWEKVEPKKKVGDIICGDIKCADCPLTIVKYHCAVSGSIKENWEDILKTYPQLEPMRPYIETELDKEVEE